VVAYENSKNIDAKGKQVDKLEDKVFALHTMIEDLQLQISKIGSPPEEHNNPSKVQNLGII